MLPKALIIGGERPVGLRVIKVMEKMGYVVIKTDDSKDVVKRFNAERFDVVFIYLSMPEDSDYEVFEAIIRESPEVPVIAIGDAVTTEAAIEASRRGAWDCITKPIESRVVLETIIDRNLERAKRLRENKRRCENLERLVEERTIDLICKNQNLAEAIVKRQALEIQLQEVTGADENVDKAKSVFLRNINQ